MWIMISGPYLTGTRTEEDRRENLRRLNKAAIDVFRKGHVPIVGVNMVLPMVDIGAVPEDHLMMPVSLALAGRCDAVLRIGGESNGAELEVEAIRANGGKVFRSIDEVPPGDDLPRG